MTKGTNRVKGNEGVGVAKAREMPTCWCPHGRERDAPWGPPGTDEETRAWHITDDHIVAPFEGGPNTAANKRPAHRLCNRMDATIRRGGTPQKDMARIARAHAAAAAEVAPPSAARVAAAVLEAFATAVARDTLAQQSTAAEVRAAAALHLELAADPLA